MVASVNLDGLVAVVTGGSRGIGREVARQLAAAGGTVAVTGRDEEKLLVLPELVETGWLKQN